MKNEEKNVNIPVKTVKENEKEIVDEDIHLVVEVDREIVIMIVVQETEVEKRIEKETEVVIEDQKMIEIRRKKRRRGYEMKIG